MINEENKVESQENTNIDTNQNETEEKKGETNNNSSQNEVNSENEKKEDKLNEQHNIIDNNNELNSKNKEDIKEITEAKKTEKEENEESEEKKEQQQNIIKNDKNMENDTIKEVKIEEQNNEKNNIISEELKETKNNQENKNIINEESKKEDKNNDNKINEIIEENEKENPNKIIENTNNEEANKNINEIKEENENVINENLKKVKLQEKDDKKYLANLEEEKELQKLINEQLKNNYEDVDSDDEEEEETFPFRFLGDVKKKGETLGIFNNRYLEIDTEKGLLKRYASSKEYPQHPMETIPIQSLKTLKKVKKLPGQEYYEFQLTFIPPNKTKEKLHLYRVRHAECRTKWFESLLKIWKHLVKNEPLPPINKNKLIFIDDQVGINQEIKHKKKKNKNKNNNAPLVCLRNFKVLAKLGDGGFGTVFKVQHILTEKIYAMKVMNKNYIIQKKYLHYVVSEFEIMKMLSGFPFVIDIHYCFQTANYLYMIIDICPNGDFTDLKYINNLKLFLAEVILAFEHIHNHGVVYRDLKPENILLDTTGHIKICDFNLAKPNVSKQKKATSFCGSPMYLSPEMLDPEGVDQRADIYGIGLLIYELVTDKPAYTAANLTQLYEKIKANKINFEMPQLKGDLKDLLKKILVANPDERISIEDIKRHPYFQDISFLKVYKKEYGPIVIKKKDASEINQNDPSKMFSKNILEGKNEEEAKKEKTNEEKKSEDEFKEQQKKLDADKDYSFLDGKISVREMKKDQKRAMKNYVREFYYVKKEDTPQTEEFQLTINGILDTNQL